jgi:hypothetical protein
MIVERSVLAECLSLSGARICQLVNEGMPEYTHGLYDLGPCIQWYVEYRAKSINESNDVVDARKHETIQADLYIEDLQHLQDVVERALTGIDRGLAEDLTDLGDPEEISDRLQLASGRIRTAIADGLDRYVATIKE